MEARSILCWLSVFVFFITQSASAQTYQAESENFVVYAPDRQLAKQAVRLAEKYRRELSIDWLGYEIPQWQEKCPVRVQVGPHAGGETSFAFVQGDNGRGLPVGWQMKIYGPPDRLLDAVLPHEVTHTIFATHFGRPLPRWADEGACTTVEHESERAKNHRMLINFLTASPSRGIPFNRMFTMKQYPHDILPLYAQGYSLAKFLINQKGRQHFVRYLEWGLASEQSNFDTKTWDRATEKYYGFKDLSQLQISWLDWVRKGSPMTAAPQVASAGGGDATLIDPGGTYSIAANQPNQPSPDADHIDRQIAGTTAPGGWYARQSRAKQAVEMPSPSPSGQPTATALPTFRPGSLKRQDVLNSTLNRLLNSTAPVQDQTIWR